MDIRNYLSGKGFTWKEKRGTNGIEAEMNCPVCKDTEKKFSINLDTGLFNCWHKNKCGVSGSFWEFQKMMGDTPKRLDSMISIAPAKPITYKPVTVRGKRISTTVENYLHSRGFKDEIIKEFRLGQNDEGTAVMYPFFKEGKVVNVKYRAIAEKKFWNEKDGEPCLFNRDMCAGGETLYITEGQDDCIALKHYGIDAVSVPGGTGDMRWIEHEWDYLNGFKYIYLLMDNDQAGQNAVDEIVKRLGKWRCYQVMLPEKDANECLKKNVPIDVLGKCLTTPIEYHHEHVKPALFFVDQIIQHMKTDKNLYGVSTGFAGIDKILKGWRQGEFSVWTGNSGSGKSTFINQIVLNLIDRQERCLTASLEMAAKNYLRWAVIQHLQKEEITEDDIKIALKTIGSKWYIFNISGEAGEDIILDAFEFAARKYGIKHFFIDSLMRVNIKDRDEYRGQKEFCTRLVNFAQEYNCHVHLVAHPRKGASDHETPDKVDVAGTAHITNMAHNVFILYRIQEEKKKDDSADNIFYIKKNREFGFEGKIMLNFKSEHKLFLEKQGTYKENSMGYIHD